MAFLEVIKHSRNILSITMTKNKSWLHKAGEIAIEILIIVFAISFSLFLERQREESNDHKLEKDFYSGLTIDLKQDREQLQSDRKFFVNMSHAFDYFKRMSDTTKLNADSINVNYNYLISSSDFVSNSAHYQALKSTGKLSIIENKELLNQIISLYETKIPILISSTRFFNDKKEHGIIAYAESHMRMGKNTNILQVMSDPIAKNYLLTGGYITQIINNYDDALKAVDAVLKKTAKED